jgi:hypothetical protein
MPDCKTMSITVVAGKTYAVNYVKYSYYSMFKMCNVIAECMYVCVTERIVITLLYTLLDVVLPARLHVFVGAECNVYEFLVVFLTYVCFTKCHVVREFLRDAVQYLRLAVDRAVDRSVDRLLG